MDDALEESTVTTSYIVPTTVSILVLMDDALEGPMREKRI